MFNSYQQINSSTTNTTINNTIIPPPPKVSLLRESDMTFNTKHPVYQYYSTPNDLEWDKQGIIYVATLEETSKYHEELMARITKGKYLLVTKELSSEVFENLIIERHYGDSDLGIFREKYDDLYFRQQDIDNSRLSG